MRVVNVAVDLLVQEVELAALVVLVALRVKLETAGVRLRHVHGSGRRSTLPRRRLRRRLPGLIPCGELEEDAGLARLPRLAGQPAPPSPGGLVLGVGSSEEHKSELQSLMR